MTIIKNRLFATGLLLVALLCMGANAQGNCSCDNPVTATTFNTLQIFFAPYEEERLNATIYFFSNGEADVVSATPQIANETFDVLCMQELWDPVLRNRVIQGLNQTYPYSYAPPAQQAQCTAGCTPAEMQTILDCLIPADCLVEEDGFDQVRCAIDGCDDVIEPLSDQCKQCLTLDTGINLNDKLRECGGLSESLTDSCQWLYDGNSDTLLLSPTPWEETDYLVFSESPLVVDTVIYGRKEVNNRVVHAFCTHLAAALPLINTEAANGAQSRQLVEWINSKLRNTTNNAENTNQLVLVMGDFNHGPSITNQGISSNHEQAYFTLDQAGFNSSLFQIGKAPCTYCDNNRLQTELERSGDLIIDHIYVKESGDYCIANADLYATLQQVSLNVPDQDQAIPLSDHYGVTAQYCHNTAGLRASNGQPLQVDAPGTDTATATRAIIEAPLVIAFTILLALVQI